MPKVLVTGATGLLGRAVSRSFQTAGWYVIGTGLSRAEQNPSITRLDLLDTEAVHSLVEAERPSLIIHSAAERSPDSVAANPDRARALNVDSTSYLVALASSLSIPFLYISTDYVFPGVPGEAPYSESSSPRATNLYGQLKLDGETAVLQHSSSQDGIPLGAVLRLPVLYGHVDPRLGNKESAVNILVDKVRDCAAGKPVVMDDWARRFPTNVEDIGDGIVELGGKWLETLGEGGLANRDFPKILQFSGKECLTKFEMCEIFAEHLGVSIKQMQRDKDGGGGGGVQRPYDTQMGTDEFEKVIGHPLKTVGFKEWWARELKN